MDNGRLSTVAMVRAVAVIAIMVVAAVAVVAVITALNTLFAGAMFTIILPCVQKGLKGGFLLHGSSGLSHERAYRRYSHYCKYHVVCLHTVWDKTNGLHAHYVGSETGSYEMLSFGCDLIFWIARQGEKC